MVYRVFVEKKPGFDNAARALLADLREQMRMDCVDGVRIVNRYDVEGVSADIFREATAGVLAEPMVDVTYDRLPDMAGYSCVCVEYLPGQYDQRADSAAQCIQLLSVSSGQADGADAQRPAVRSAVIYALRGGIPGEQLEKIRKYLINPVEAHEVTMRDYDTLRDEPPAPEPIGSVEGFISMDDASLDALRTDMGFAMDLADLQCCREYFGAQRRDPTVTELRVLDTYWSDHCRHTTFGTVIDNISIEEPYIVKAFQNYLSDRSFVYGSGVDSRPITLMDIATMAMRAANKAGKLPNLDVSDENNACSVRINVKLRYGREETWLLMFKNETHNHPTEIEPFGGAATCLGGAIRDPLSGRAYVYNAMRITGAGNPHTPADATIPGKLPQAKLTRTAAQGFSSYGNQIGLATGGVHEIYHPGYTAKRMELGAVVGAAPASAVRRAAPEPGDVVILVGGRTGRDGCGGATGSSRAHTVDSLTQCGAEVQKGNPPEERKLQRLFRNPEAAALIKRCNDFGAGGVAVAVGELAPGLDIDLDAVPKKYEGLDGTELAISESQERMAVVLSQSGADTFISMAAAENLEATVIAKVTEQPRLLMRWAGSTIVDIERAFLDTNGAKRHTSVRVGRVDVSHLFTDYSDRFQQRNFNIIQSYHMLLADLNICSQRGLVEQFDSTNGAGTVVMPFGGKFQYSPSQYAAAKIPVSVYGQKTETCSVMTYGFNPYVAERSPYHGGFYAVLEAVSKLAAAGCPLEDMYLSLQEYFPRTGGDPERWGLPFAALLGAHTAQRELGVTAIGGKDSMSGSFENLDVPPTLVAVGVSTAEADKLITNEFKKPGSRVYLFKPQYDRTTRLADLADFRNMLTYLSYLIRSGLVLSCRALGAGGAAEAVAKMAFGSRVGFAFNGEQSYSKLFDQFYGSIIVEMADGAGTLNPSVIPLGLTTSDERVTVNGVAMHLDTLQEAWEHTLEPIFPTKTANSSTQNDSAAPQPQQNPPVQPQAYAAPRQAVQDNQQSQRQMLDSFMEELRQSNSASAGTYVYGAGAAQQAGAQQPAPQGFTFSAPQSKPQFNLGAARPRVLIPIFPGTNCEYDTADAFIEAGGDVKTFVFRNLTPDDISRSIEQFASYLRMAHILALPGGFSGGDEPDGSGKFICAVLRSPAVRQAVEELLARRCLIVGICNGFQALVKTGLLPYGEFRLMGPDDPTLTFNEIGRLQSRLVTTRVLATRSPWLADTRPGELATVAIASGEGRFRAAEAQLSVLFASGQVATQYVDMRAQPSMDPRFNPSGSDGSIESLVSPDGLIYGRMGHPERYTTNYAKNVPGKKDPVMFKSGIKYFK